MRDRVAAQRTRTTRTEADAVRRGEPRPTRVMLRIITRPISARDVCFGSLTAPGIYAQVTIVNSDSATMHRIVTVSAEHASVRGTFTLSMELMSAAD